MTVEVFKTNVPEHLAGQVVRKLRNRYTEARVTLDLEDCDKVLRVEAPVIQPNVVIASLAEIGLSCEVMMD